MNRIGIMGGTFNPIHYGHLRMAELAFEQLQLSKVYFMPSKNPPHKEIMGEMSDDDRCEMTRLAIADNPHFEFSDFEQKRGGITYTSDTLMQWKEEHPEDEIYFILGSDSFQSITHWHLPEVICKNCILTVAERIDRGDKTIVSQKQYLEESFGARIHVLDFPILEYSSTDIRIRLKENKSIRYLVPDVVYQWINENWKSKSIVHEEENFHG